MSMSNGHDRERRRFLEVIGAAGATGAVVGTVGCGDGTTGGSDAGGGGGTDTGNAPTDNGGVDTGPPTPTGFDAGPVGDYASNIWRFFGAPNNLIVARDDMGLFAMTRICTHERCNVNSRENAAATTSTTGLLSCPCHGSRYNANGAVTTGPATRPLQHFFVGIANGRVLVNTGMVVDANARIPAA